MAYRCSVGTQHVFVMETDQLLMDDVNLSSSEPRRRMVGTNGRDVLSHYSIGDSSDEELLDIGRPAGFISDGKVRVNIV